MIIKRCASCKEYKDELMFSKLYSTPDGLCRRCKDCDKYYNEYRNEQIYCYILKQHSKDLHNDPEHLDTKFIRSLIERD